VTDPMFPGHQDQIHLQHLYRKDSIDIDVYQFVVSKFPGVGGKTGYSSDHDEDAGHTSGGDRT
jgi:hypothetical protein